jgi:hypothetical protein
MGAVGADPQQELEALRARVAALEAELVEQARRTERIVAEAQARTYWLDRWHLDLNALMRRPGIGPALDLAFRAARKLKRGPQKLRRILTRAP